VKHLRTLSALLVLLVWLGPLLLGTADFAAWFLGVTWRTGVPWDLLRGYLTVCWVFLMSWPSSLLMDALLDR
jgi:hypothetical protein